MNFVCGREKCKDNWLSHMQNFVNGGKWLSGLSGNWRPQVAPTQTLRKILIRLYQTKKVNTRPYQSEFQKKSYLSFFRAQMRKPDSRQRVYERPELPRLGGPARGRIDFLGEMGYN